MTWLIGIIITFAALLGAVKGIVEFFDWLKKRKEQKDETTN
jgi:hypothetical protein